MLRIFGSTARNTLVGRRYRRLQSTKSGASDAAPAASGAPQTLNNDTSLFNQHVYEERKAFIRLFEEKKGKNAMYPPFVSDCSVGAYLDEFSHLEVGQKVPEKEYTLVGRIMSKRDASKKLVFYVIRSEMRDVQIVANLADYKDSEEDYNLLNRNLRRGDIIAVKGFPYRTKTGELSISARYIQLLAPCLHQLPDYNCLTDKELRYRNRHVDLLLNRGVRDVFITRSKVINALRQFLDNRGFIEVETPMLQKHPGGAIAKPFQTYLHAHHANLYMRIAPELYLKQLIVGGIERVYEIGKQFRNEGVDLTHNPEFTTCEFYQAYSDYNQLMTTTEEILRHIIFSVLGGYTLKVDIPRKKGHPELGNETVELDFSKPFRRIYLEEDLAKCLNIDRLPDVNDPNSVNDFLELCRKHNIEAEAPYTSVKLLDNLVEHFLESQCTQPTFLCHQPLATSPLARQHRSIAGVTERFELFAGRMELCNAYTELNDPEEQRKRFAHQVALGESLGFNEEWFCQVLEWGLPPTGGWGLGIDRLVMLITGRFAIKEVLLFPFMKDQIQNPAPAKKDQPNN